MQHREQQLKQALGGLVGLIQLVLARSDVPGEVRDALTGNHRYRYAVAMSALADGDCPHCEGTGLSRELLKYVDENPG